MVLFGDDAKNSVRPLILGNGRPCNIHDLIPHIQDQLIGFCLGEYGNRLQD